MSETIGTPLTFPSLLALFEKAPIAMVATEGPEHRVVAANEMYYQYAGMTSSHVIGKSFAELPTNPELIQENWEKLNRVYQTGQPYEEADIPFIFESNGTRSETYWKVRILSYHEPDDSSRIRGLVVYILDNTQQRLAQQHTGALVRAEAERAQELQVIFENILDGIVVIDASINVFSINRVACELLGVSQEEVKRDPSVFGRSMTKIFKLDGNPYPLSEWPSNVTRREKRWADGEFIYERLDGKRIALYASSMPILNEEGEIRLMIILFRDISPKLEAARSQQELLNRLESERVKLDAIINSIEVGLIIFDLEGRVILMNRQLLRFAGAPSSAIIGSSARQILEQFSPLALNPASFAEDARKILESPDRHHTFEVRLSPPLNLDLKIVSFPIFDQQNRLLGWGALIDDVTRINQMLKLRSQFIATASHELRTPLTGIVGFAELLLNREVNPDIKQKWLQNIYSESLRVSRMVENMLNISRMEAGVLQLKRTEFSLANTVRVAVNSIRSNYPARTINLDLADLPQSDTTLLADEPRLQEAIKQLISNALKFSPEDKPVEIKLIRSTGELAAPPDLLTEKPRSTLLASHQSWLLLKIRDYGIGIPKEDLPHIFRPFYRSKNPSAHSLVGSGLGLALAEKLVELHGGLIWAVSEPGDGSTFFLALPQN